MDVSVCEGSGELREEGSQNTRGYQVFHVFLQVNVAGGDRYWSSRGRG